MIPQHVIDYWREQGKDEAWILGRIEAFAADVKKRNSHCITPTTKPAKYSHRKRKLPPVSDLLALVQSGLTYNQAGAKVGYSGERVRQVLKAAGYGHGSVIKNRDAYIKQLDKSGIPRRTIALRVKMSEGYVSRVIGHRPNPKPIGCPDCTTNEYARGLCHNCYERWWHRGKPDLPQVKEAVRPWSKAKGKTQ